MAQYGHTTVRFGLPGSADILGIVRLNVAGRPIGALLAVECKTKVGRQSEQQRRFEAMVRAFGGCYVLARSAAEAVESVEAFKSEAERG